MTGRGVQADFAQLDALVRERAGRWLDDLRDYCRIPSETGNSAALDAAAEWTGQRLERLGARVEVVTAAGARPLVVGEIGSGERTVICLQHYDVQPSTPLELWQTPPFEPAVRDGRLYARGAVDNKGCLLVRIEAIEAYLEAIGDLPCRVRFVVEGEEENGSRGLDDLVAAAPWVVQGDAVLNEGGYVDPAGRPLLTCGLRGMLYVELSVRTLHADVHSDMAMLLPNAALRLVEVIASLRRADGSLDFAGLRDDVLPPTAEQLALLAVVPFEEQSLKHTWGVEHFVAGRTADVAQRATMFEPTCNISGFVAGWTGAEIKTVIPAEARLKLDMRLVPNQDPRRIQAALRRHLDARGFADVRISTFMAQAPWWSDASHPIVDAAARASEAVFDLPALRVLSSPSSGPMYQMCAPHRLPSVGFGGVHVDSHSHAPNENLRLDLADRARRVFGRFLPLFAELPEVPRLDHSA